MPRLARRPPQAEPAPRSALVFNRKTFEPAFRDFLANVTILSKNAGYTKFVPYDLPWLPGAGAQEYVLNEIFTGLENGIHWFVIGKARQLGMTTLMLLLDIFWCAMFPGLQGAMVFDEAANKEKIRLLLEEILERLPATHPLPIIRHNSGGIVFDHGPLGRSMLDYLIAGTKKKPGSLGRSRAFNFLHGCVPPGTPVILADGRIRPIEDVCLGDTVLTHAGSEAKVIDVIGQSNDKGSLIRVTPWLGQAVEFTEEHKIPTRRGIVHAKELRIDDWLIMPVRPISDGAACPVFLRETPDRAQHGGMVSAGAGQKFPFDKETGFALGYYLAEGTIIRSSINRNPSGISFARHRDEAEYAERAYQALKPFVSSRSIVDRNNCLTTYEILYGAALADWVDHAFGHTDDKAIPDWVFHCGREFCEGLLTGLLCGDGSKQTEWLRDGSAISKVVLPTTRSSIAMQARDLAASLGYGWGAASYKPAGEYYGRVCKPIWRVAWTGDAARALRELMGLSPIMGGKPHVQKYYVEGNSVYIRIRKIEGGIECPFVWDLSVDHDDHTFRTPHMAIGNTETAQWGDEEGLESLISALSDEYPARLFIFESTGKGRNHFYSLWEDAGDDDLTKKAIFIAWWRHPGYVIKQGTKLFERYGYQELARDEAETHRLVREEFGYRITPEQWAWYRHRKDPQRRRDVEEVDEGKAQIVEVEYPSYPEEMFRLTGSPFLPGRVLDDAMQRASKQLFKGYWYRFGQNFVEIDRLQSNTVRTAQLKVWHEPHVNGKYIIAADPAYGSSDTADRYAAQVLRVYADRVVQCAEFCMAVLEPFQFTWVVADLCGWYRFAKFILEINGPGEAVMTEFRHLQTLLDTGRLVGTSHEAIGEEKTEDEEIDRLLGREPRRRPPSPLINVRNYLYHRPDAFGAQYNQHWKALSLDTPLPTPSGWTKMGEVEIGDRLIDNEGNPCVVTATSEIYGDRPCFEVTFGNGTGLIADHDHLWQVSERLDAWHYKTRIVKTADLDPETHFIIKASAFNLPSAILPINPYVLGVWLGDGHSADGRITVHKDDLDEIVGKIAEAGYRCGPAYVYQGRNIRTFMVIGLREQLASCGLLNNKFVPSEYLRGSLDQRRLLLCGLMDTDGNISRGQCGFTTTSKSLAVGFAELIRTLGIKAGTCKRNRTLFAADGRELQCAEATQFYFTSDVHFDGAVFSLERKLYRQIEFAELRKEQRNAKQDRHKVVGVWPVQSVPVRCVQVDSPSRLYLAGEGMIPTHNTTANNKPAIMTQLGDQFMMSKLVINSVQAISEMKTLTRKDGYIEADGKAKDDRAVALALGVRCWIDWERAEMDARGATFEREEARDRATGDGSDAGGYMTYIMAERARERARMQRQAGGRLGRRRNWNW